jgi:hypothetical protein
MSSIAYFDQNEFVDGELNPFCRMHNDGWSIVQLMWNGNDIIKFHDEQRQVALSRLNAVRNDPNVYMICVISHDKHQIANYLRGELVYAGEY